jgi:hypothetical protein
LIAEGGGEMREGADVAVRNPSGRHSLMIWTLTVALGIVGAFVLFRAAASLDGYQWRETQIVLNAPGSPALSWFVDETETAPIGRYYSYAADWCETWLVSSWGDPLSASMAEQVAKQYAKLGYTDDPYRGAAYMGCLEGLSRGR